jgi:hypothetical protein
VAAGAAGASVAAGAAGASVGAAVGEAHAPNTIAAITIREKIFTSFISYFSYLVVLNCFEHSMTEEIGTWD